MKRLVIAVLMSFLPVAHGQQQPSRNDFAYESAIVIDSAASVYRVRLTPDVYRGVTRPDLGDVRVFNAADETVPHVVVSPKSETTNLMMPLPLFPVALDSAPSVASAQIQLNKDGSIIYVAPPAASEPARRAYLLDASQTTLPIAALSVDVGPVPDGFIGTVRVEHSDDLNAWYQAGGGVLANLRREGHELERRRLALPMQRYKYFRLRWAEPIDYPIVGVLAELRAPGEVTRVWTAADAERNDRAGEYRFVVDLQASIDTLRVPLPDNTVSRVTVLSRAKDGDGWIPRGEKTVYSLQTGAGTLVDNEVQLNGWGTPHAQWLLRFGGVLAESAENYRLELGWRPQYVVFVARGQAPFTLAFGHVKATSVDHGLDDLLRSVRSGQAQGIAIGDAALAAPVAIRGEAARLKTWDAARWQQWLLWAVLLVGVGGLAYVATRLLRQLKRESDGA
jgi:hypothetical protein